MRYFTYDELTHSDVAEKLQIDNTPNELTKMNIKSLVESVLDPLRTLYGRPINVKSGYRCRTLNRLVGDPTPFDVQHVIGDAADLVVAEGETGLKYLAELAITYRLPFGRLCIEGDHLHITHRFGHPQERACYVFDGEEYERVSVEQFWVCTLGRDLPVIYWNV